MTRLNRTIEVSADLFDGKGSISTRVNKLRHLQQLGFVDKKLNIPKIANDGALGAVEVSLLKQASAASRTSGALIRTTEGGDNPRVHTQISTYSGDPEACWGPFKMPGFVGRINKDVDTVEQTVKLKPGQKITIS